jgi:hypothetical protein
MSSQMLSLQDKKVQARDLTSPKLNQPLNHHQLVKHRLAYAAFMIGKEAIVHSDKSHAADYFLEKFLSYVFQVKGRTGEELVKAKRPRESKTRMSGIHKQTMLDL